ncbi:MAG: hypothetical protein ABSD96_13085 [Candidatus Korobacteraceae bacterium]
MRSKLCMFLVLASLAGTALAAKPHVISFGKVLAVKLFIGPGEDHTVSMNVRALMVDGNPKEFTTGESHAVTDRIFVVRRAFRVNDNLPADQGKVPHWVWQRAAYCGVSANGEKLYTVVVQLGLKKAVLRQEIGAASQGEDPDSNCTVPTWERNPARVTFHPKSGQSSSFIVHGHAADVAPGAPEEGK